MQENAPLLKSIPKTVAYNSLPVTDDKIKTKRFERQKQLTTMVIFIISFSQGMMSLADLPMYYLYKDVYGLTPASQSTINGISSICWAIKPLYGLISDSYPIFGYRRKSYLLIFACVSTVAWMFIALSPIKSFALTLTVQIIANIGVGFCNMIGQALVVEKSQNRNGDEVSYNHKEAADNVSFFFLMCSIGTLMSSYSSGLLLQEFGVMFVIGLSALFPATIMIGAFLLNEEKINDYEPIENRDETEDPHLPERSTMDTYVPNNPFKPTRLSLRQQLITIRAFVSQSFIAVPLIFVFIFMCAPSTQDAMFYFYSNELHFGEELMGRFKFVYSLFDMLGILIFNKFLQNVPFKKIIFYSTFVMTLFGLIQLGQVLRLNLIIGIPDTYMTLSTDAIGAALAEVNCMPIVVLACKLCPKNIEGTTYALVMSVINMGFVVSYLLGGILTTMLGIGSNNYRNLWILVLIANMYQLFIVPFLKCVPINGYGEEEEKKPPNKQEEEEDEEKLDKDKANNSFKV